MFVLVTGISFSTFCCTHLTLRILAGLKACQSKVNSGHLHLLQHDSAWFTQTQTFCTASSKGDGRIAIIETDTMEDTHLSFG